MLHLDDVSYSYPHSEKLAVQGVSLRVEPGALVLCTGQSGCGKSTVIRIANGLAPHYLKGALHGSASVGGTCTRTRAPADLALSVGSLFQEPERQFFALTVGDEIAFSLQWRGWPSATVAKAVEASAERMGIRHLLPQTIFGLSEGQKQKVALASLLAARPKALLLDEPSANLDPESTADLADTLLHLKSEGIAILVVDHRLSWLRGAADSVHVLHEGRTVAQGDFSLLDDAELRERYGLRAATVPDPRDVLPVKAWQADSTFFGCEGLSFAYPRGKSVFANVSLGFTPGEVVALVGGNGAGKTTLARLFTGLEKSAGGFVAVKGKPVSAKHLPRHAQVVLQNAGHQLRMRSVHSELDDAAAGIFRDKQNRAEKVTATLERYGLSALAGRHPQSLSGGEKQRLAVAAATIRDPEVLILDEPTSGLDGKNMRRMARSIQQAAGDGAAIIVITHDLELMAAACTRKVVLPHNNT